MRIPRIGVDSANVDVGELVEVVPRSFGNSPQLAS
jgi:hypothetical protein